MEVQMFDKKELMRKMEEELKKQIQVDPADKKWLDSGAVDMLSAFMGNAEKRLIERINGVADASMKKLVMTSDVAEMRVLQGQIQAFWSVLATIKIWRDYAAKKEKQNG
jgi:hypothetical protein